MRVEGHESTSSGAQGVVGGIGAAPRRIASETAEVARSVRAHAAESLVAEQLDRSFAIFDGIAVVAIMRRDEARTGAVVVAAGGEYTALARAKYAPFEPFLRVAKRALVACEAHC